MSKAHAREANSTMYRTPHANVSINETGAITYTAFLRLSCVRPPMLAYNGVLVIELAL